MTIEELNTVIETGDIDEFIRVCEARQVKALSRIADEVTGRGGVRLVLIAGASSAGKTTTAKRLCTQVRVNGFDAMHLSTDDYFVGDARNPRDENGELDYETVEAVDIARLSSDINRLVAGESVRLRGFDFLKHDGFDREETVCLPENGVVMLEGLHALNPLLTADVPNECKYRVFVEPKTQLEVFATSRLPPADGRFLRRLVRDNQFRKMPPTETFRLWPKVLAGERKWIDPFRAGADAEFDSGLEYELSVLKLYAEGLLELVKLKEPGNGKAQTLAALLSSVLPGDPSQVPGDSILRETIGGSLLSY
ncbi:MAG: nucleoside kinase [Kiritimatiellae bacterium]|nr:nucleoside kinase [Kiritimatiellia bacterium]